VVKGGEKRIGQGKKKPIEMTQEQFKGREEQKVGGVGEKRKVTRKGSAPGRGRKDEEDPRPGKRKF